MMLTDPACPELIVDQLSFGGNIIEAGVLSYRPTHLNLAQEHCPKAGNDHGPASCQRAFLLSQWATPITLTHPDGITTDTGGQSRHRTALPARSRPRQI